MKYPDKVRLVSTESDIYGDEAVVGFEEVPACFVKRSGTGRSYQMGTELSDAAVYLDHLNDVVLSRVDALEGAYIHAYPYTDSSWHRIESLHVAERKLLDNAMDNVYCKLEKVAGIAYVRVS